MRAFVVEKVESGAFKSEVLEIETPCISKDEILIEVSYSSLNYKDALSSIGNAGVTKVFPHITGIDVAGKVKKTNSKDFKVGQSVLVTGYDMGMNTNGGHAQFVKVPSSWAIPLPKNISQKEIMTYGTAGLTAALSVNELLNNGITSGKILVSGATGGVGSISVAILSKLGFEVTAISSKEEKFEFLKQLGVNDIILRSEFDSENKRPLGAENYDGVIDTVGGNILAQALKQIRYDGVATCCGLTSSFELNTNLFPFILRGVRLIGIDSVEAKLEKKISAWEKIANEFKLDNLEKLTTQIGLEDIGEAYKKLLAGKAVGRYLVKIEQE